MPPFVDISGKKYGRLKVIKKDETRHGYWICQCDCGTIKSIRACNLKAGTTKSCGCLNQELIHQKQRNSKDITGHYFGELEAIKYVSSDDNGTRWLCKCHNCGSFTTVTLSYLKKYKSCGCLMRQASFDNIYNYHNEVLELNTIAGILKRKDAFANNKLGIKGIWYNHKKNHYVAYISFKNKKYTLLRSQDLQKCIDARNEAEKYLHADFLEWYQNVYKNTINKK